MSVVQRFFERERRESNSTLKDPAKWLYDAFTGGHATAAGVRVNETTVEGIPAVYSCVRIVSETVAQFPLKLYRKTGDKKAPDPSHPLYSVLHDLANPEMTAFEFRDMLTSHLCLWGNAYAEIDRRGDGGIRALWPLSPDRMRVDRDELNRLRYRYLLADGKRELTWIWNAQRPPLLHLRVNSRDGITGRSMVSILRDAFGAAKAVQDFGARFFGNNALPGMLIMHPGKLKPEAKERLRESWTTKFMGSDKAHKVAVLEEGVKVEKLTIPPDDAQFLQTRQLTIEEIGGLFRIPPHMLSHTTKATSWGSGIEQLGQGFVTFTMMPWLQRWQQAIARDLLTYKSFETHEALFIVNALVRGDIQTRYAAYVQARQNGWLNADEIRALEDMNEITGGSGKLYWMPANMLPAGSPVAVENEPEPTPPANVPEPSGVM